MLSENIYVLRRKSGLSQEQLAEKIGVSRQAVSKWEGGLSTPELDKLKALSECFQISIDELTGNPSASSPESPSKADAGPVSRKNGESRLGLGLCITGAVCLFLSGLFFLLRPSAAGYLNESSTITLNGTGILIASFVLLMLLGMVLILKKK